MALEMHTLIDVRNGGRIDYWFDPEVLVDADRKIEQIRVRGPASFMLDGQKYDHSGTGFRTFNVLTKSHIVKKRVRVDGPEVKNSFYLEQAFFNGSRVGVFSVNEQGRVVEEGV